MFFGTRIRSLTLIKFEDFFNNKSLISIALSQVFIKYIFGSTLKATSLMKHRKTWKISFTFLNNFFFSISSKVTHFHTSLTFNQVNQYFLYILQDHSYLISCIFLFLIHVSARNLQFSLQKSLLILFSLRKMNHEKKW